MSARARTKSALHASWSEHGIAMWGWNGETAIPPTALRNLAARLLGHWWPQNAESAQVAVVLGDGRAPNVPALILDPITAAELLAERYPTAEWSPSLRWFRSAAGLAMLAAGTGRVLPATRTEGLRWRADWQLVDDPVVEAAIDTLQKVAPPVVAAATSSADTVAADVVASLADGACRWVLAADHWRPDLARSRRAPAVAMRRIMSALIDDPVFTGSSEHHELAFATWSAALSEMRAMAEGAVPTACRGRLVPPPREDIVAALTESGHIASPEQLDNPEDAFYDNDADLSDAPPWRVEFEVVSTEDPSLVVSWKDVWDDTPAARQMVEGGALTPVRRRVKELAKRLASRVTVFEELADQVEPWGVELSVDDVGFLLVDGLDACDRAGAPILVPSGLVKRRAQITAKATPSESGGISADLGNAMVDVDWGLALGDDELTTQELELLASAKSGLVRMKGEWVQVDKEQVKAALTTLNKRQAKSSSLSAADLLRIAAESMIEGEGDPGAVLVTGENISADGWLNDLLGGLPDEQLTEAVEPPGFVGTLRPYQRRAVGWLQFLGRLGLGGCLADDMGLGKTPTALAYLQSLTRTRPCLIICPLSVVHNWESEAGRFTPDLTVYVAHGPNRLRLEQFADEARRHDMVITTFGTMSRDIESFGLVDWDVVVCDEAQAIKNHHTRAARSVRRLSANQKLALTGTPVENRLLDLWAILDAVNPGMLGGVTWFRERFATPIEQHNDPDALAGLHCMTGPFILRRTKSNRALVPDLPDKVEQVAWATLTREQASLYKAVVDEFLAEAEKKERHADPGGADVGMQRRGLVLATLTRLKQICNHPAHFLADGGRLAKRSGKLIRFDELVDELLDTNERALIFTQYRQMGDLLARHIKERLQIDAPFLHGGVPKKKRDAMVEKFQSGDGPPLQIVSVKAGGTGLNLTRASRVIHYDRWWNPAVEDQATDRAWRIGQESTVFVHKLVCQGTLEERIDQLLTQKKELANSVVGSGEGWLTEMSTDQLRELMSLDMSTVEVAQ